MYGEASRSQRCPNDSKSSSGVTVAVASTKWTASADRPSGEAYKVSPFSFIICNMIMLKDSESSEKFSLSCGKLVGSEL
ncbi:hypothetical protein WAI453_006463 [Rhynchosporium graminicola]